MTTDPRTSPRLTPELARLADERWRAFEVACAATGLEPVPLDEDLGERWRVVPVGRVGPTGPSARARYIVRPAVRNARPGARAWHPPG